MLLFGKICQVGELIVSHRQRLTIVYMAMCATTHDDEFSKDQDSCINEQRVQLCEQRKSVGSERLTPWRNVQNQLIFFVYRAWLHSLFNDAGVWAHNVQYIQYRLLLGS